MSEQNKSVVRRYMDALNAKDVAGLDEIFSPDYANHSPRLGIIGKAATLQALTTNKHSRRSRTV